MSELKSMQPRLNNKSGFTLVELLIVIVVIAILAAVSVVAYNGVNRRAVNSQVAAALAQEEKALKLHFSETGSPLAANTAWYHSSITNMAGVCVAGKWPSTAEIQEIIGGWYHDRATFCRFAGGNTSQTPNEVIDMYTAVINSSPARDTFPAMPMFDSIEISALDSGGNASSVLMNGIRYAYNNSATNPQSYLYYPIYGKTCLPGDRTVRMSDTIWVSAGGGSWNGTFTTGGDYTANDTAHCIRTINW